MRTKKLLATFLAVLMVLTMIPATTLTSFAMMADPTVSVLTDLTTSITLEDDEMSASEAARLAAEYISDPEDSDIIVFAKNGNEYSFLVYDGLAGWDAELVLSDILEGLKGLKDMDVNVYIFGNISEEPTYTVSQITSSTTDVVFYNALMEENEAKAIAAKEFSAPADQTIVIYADDSESYYGIVYYAITESWDSIGITDYPISAVKGLLPYYPEIYVIGTVSNGFTISVAANITNGTVRVDKSTAAKDETVTVTVTADSGYELDTLTVNDGNGNLSTAGSAGTYTFTMGEKDVTVTATFKEIHNHKYTYTADGATLTAKCSCGETQTVTLKADNKTYDGTANAATLDGSVDGVDLTDVKYYNGETELASAPVNAGTYTAKLTKGNATATATYTIAKSKALKITNSDGQNAVHWNYTYDGQSHSTSDLIVNLGDSNVPFSDPSVKIYCSTDNVNWTVTEDTSFSLSSVSVCYQNLYIKAEHPNYETATGILVLRIYPAELTVTGTTVEDKTYDGSQNGTVKQLGTITGGIIGNDDVTIDTARVMFNDAGAGKNVDVTVEYTFKGEDGANYKAQTYHKATINKADIKADVTATDITYDSLKVNANLRGVANKDFNNAKIEYAISTESNPTNYYWQDEATFTGLMAETDYYLFVKVTSVANYNDLITDGVKVTTASFKSLLDEYIGQLVDELEEIPEDINDIIAAAIDDLEEFEPDNEKTLDENKEAAKDIADKAKTDLAEAIKEAQENELEAYKQEAINELDAAGEDVNDILANAKTAIEEVELSDEKDLDAAKAEIDEIVAKAKADLADAGKTDDTQKSISGGIGVGAILAVVATVVTIILTFLIYNFSSAK